MALLFLVPTSGVKSSYIKEILTREFESKIGFYSCPQKNLSELVYDASRSGLYVEAALFTIGISNEQLVQIWLSDSEKILTQKELSSGRQKLKS